MSASNFPTGHAVVWSAQYLEKGRTIDERWYQDNCNIIGRVEYVQRCGDVVVQWEGVDTTTVHPPERLALYFGPVAS